MKKLVLGLFCTFAFVSLSSCSKSDDNGGDGNNNKEATYTLRFTGTPNVDIQQIFITKGDGTTETLTDEYGSSWEKVITVKNGFSAGANAFTTDDKSGKLEGQIIKDGKVIKTSTSEGPIMTVALSTHN